jgi:thiol:disulfide interchange protein DsbD
MAFIFTLSGANASLFGGNSDEPLEVEQAFKFSAQQLDGNRFLLAWDIEPRYYLYQDRIELTLPEGVSQLTRSDSATDTKEDPVFGVVEVFHDRAEVTVELARTSTAMSNGQFEVSYQGCWEGGICYPPVTGVVAYADLAEAPELLKTTPDDATTSEIISEQGQFLNTLSGSSTLTLIGVFFLAGLALSLTPCVFPMIPILSGIIAGHGHNTNARHGLALSIIYVLAMALTYTIAGVLAGLFGANLQAALQAPAVIAVFSLLFVLLAGSMFGFYELQMPSSVQTWLSRNSDKQKGGSYLGVAVMGFLSALIVGPCMAAPLAGALIYIGQTGDPVIGGVALFSLSIGMGIPLILIGTSAAKYMPRAGLWMESVKAGFGVVLLLMAVWMLDRIVPVEVTMGLVALILIITSVFMGVFESHTSEIHGVKKIAKGVGVILLVYGASLTLGLLSGGKSLIYPLKGLVSSSEATTQAKSKFVTVTNPTDLDAQLSLAKSRGQAVLLDYYADWCVSCKELDYVTFADVAVKSTMAQMLLVKVDVTANDEASKQLTKRYEVLGPPTLIFYDGTGQYRKELTLVGVPSPEQFLQMSKQL